MQALQYGRYSTHQQRQSGPKRFQGPQEPPAAKASVVRTVNFNRLARAAGGADALGTLLGMTVGRLKELEGGRDFTDETAFYVEHELELPSGWLDRKDAPVPRVIARREEPEEQNISERLEVSRKVEQNTPQPSFSVPKAPKAGEDSKATKEPSVVSTPEPTSGPSLVAKAETSEVTPMSTSSVNDAVKTARDMRRENLKALTSWPKSKSGLARLLNKTPANVSHLIHGEKNFDREAALEIERVAGLPENWFEIPRTANDVPAAVVASLTGTSTVPVVQLGGDAPLRKRGRPRRTPEVAPAAPAAKATKVAKSAKAKPAAAAPAASAAPANLLPQASADVEPRRRGRPRKNVAPSAASSSHLQSVAAPANTAVALPTGPVMTETTRRQLRETEGKMGPIAEALVKTIMEKSSSGALSEKAAYKMLSEVMDT